MNIVAAMIVRNEEAVLGRCFNSLVPLVDRIIVNDNGSIDSTPRIIADTDVAVSVPAPWIDFSTNRNVVLRVARKWGEYVLCGIDADEELVIAPPWKSFEWPVLNADVYTIDVHLDDRLVYPRAALVRSGYPWDWRGVVHEALYPQDGAPPPTYGHIGGVFIRSHRDGARSKDPTTQDKDYRLLTTAYALDPYNPRTTFYLAQHCKDMGKLDEAKVFYTKRTGMGDYHDEVWYSQYMLGRIADWQDEDPRHFYQDAYEFNPSRAEPLFHAADWCRRQDYNNLAVMYANAAPRIPPESGLFIEPDVYDWRLLDVIATCAWYTPHREIGKEASNSLLSWGQFPKQHAARIQSNHDFYTRM